MRCLILILHVFLVSLGGVVPSFASDAGNTEALAQRIDAILTDYLAPEAPGAAVLVARDDEVIFRRAYGMADLELGVPMRPDMVFRIGSITKQMTATAVAILAEAGRLGLDDRVAAHLPELSEIYGQVTLRHLLTHTAGVRDVTKLEGFQTRKRYEVEPDTVLGLLRGTPLDFVPGSEFAYSNANYFLLGLVIERVSGKSYEEYLQQVIFGPAGMIATQLDRPGKVVANRVRGYDEIGGRYVNCGYLDMSNFGGAGALLSSVDDLAAWSAAIESGKLLPRESLEKLRTPYALPDGSTTLYGGGWSINEFFGHRELGHSGSINGFYGIASRYPNDGVFVAVLRNQGNPATSVRYLSQRIAAEVIGIELPAHTRADVAPAVLEVHAGRYRFPEFMNTTARVTLEDNTLVLVGLGPRLVMVPTSRLTYFVEDSFTTCEFEVDKEGRTTALKLKLGKRVVIGERVGDDPES